MSKWSAITVTAAGKALAAKCVASAYTLKFTKFELGSGTLDEGMEAEDLSALVTKEQDVGLNRMVADGEKFTIRATMTNAGVYEGYFVREMGLFAADPETDEEILFGYFTDGEPDYLPPERIRVIDSEISVTLVLSGAENVTASIDMDNYATLRDVDDARLRLTEVYPVGAIYLSTVATDPGELFANTVWEALPSGRMLLAAGGDYKAGATGGEATHKLTTAEMPSHTHTGKADSAGAHYHGTWGENGVSGPYGVYKSGRYAGSNGGWDYDNNIVKTSTDGAHTHTLTIQATGEGTAHNNMPPYLVVYMWQRIS